MYIIAGDEETHSIDEQAINRYGGRADDEFKLRDLFPTHFGEFFEIFVFFMELKWHYEIEDAIAAAGERIDQHHNSNGPGAQHKDDNYLLDFAKHYFVNKKTPLWKFCHIQMAQIYFVTSYKCDNRFIFSR